MGLKNTKTNKTFVSIKNGSFYRSDDKETPYDSLEGVVTNLYYRDEEFEGKKYRKFYLDLQDPVSGEVFSVGSNAESSYTSSVVSFLRSVDLTKPIELKPSQTTSLKPDGSSYTNRVLFVAQNGNFAKSFYNMENPLPAWEKVKVGKQEILDKSAFFDAIEDAVNTALLPIVKGNVLPPVAEQESSATTDETDDLPWNK